MNPETVKLNSVSCITTKLFYDEGTSNLRGVNINIPDLSKIDAVYLCDLLILLVKRENGSTKLH